jgi:hypothetical protein
VIYFIGNLYFFLAQNTNYFPTKFLPYLQNVHMDMCISFQIFLNFRNMLLKNQEH